MNKKAFTLVELIVVITILAVLATVAFISFQGYGQSARDSTRLSDLKSMEKILDLSKLTNNRYPTPVNSTSVTYSGSVAWTQGVFGQTAYTSNASMSNVPIDPVTSLEYAYSITSNGQEYQLAAVLENPVTSTITQATYAGTQEAQVYVKGNYNGQFLKVRKNNTTYLLGVPSILTSDIVSSQLLEDIITNKRLVYNGYKNLPASFSGSIYKTDGGFDFGGAPYLATEVILFEGDIEDLETNQAERVTFFDKLQASYSGSVISDQDDISELLRVDSSSASNYVAISLNNSLKTSIAVSNVSRGGSQGGESTPSCPSNPNPDSDFAFDSGSNTITGYTGGAGSVVIPCTIGGVDVLHIGRIIPGGCIIDERSGEFCLEGESVYPFQNIGITSVNIPSSVTSIGDSAFQNNSLTSINIPSSVTNIGESAFSDNLLTSLIIPNSFTSIGDSAFQNNSLTSVIIPSSVTNIGESAFYNNFLTSVIIPSSVTSIGDSAFSTNDFTSIIIPSSVTTIGVGVFYNNELTTVTIPSSITSIGASAFRDNLITSINIPSSVINIGGAAFDNNLLTSITIPSSVTIIGDFAFYDNNLEANTIVIMCTLPTLGSSVFFQNGPSNATNLPNPGSCTS